MTITQTLFPWPQPFTDNTGKPLSGGTLWFYAAGTSFSTPQNTYSDQGLTVLNPNPITLNSAGYPEVSNTEVQIYPINAAYDVLVKDSGGTTIHSWTNIEPTAPWNFNNSTLTFPVAAGGTTHSGGIPYFSSASVLSSSAVLTQHGVVVGEGTGGAPVATTAGTNLQALFGNTGADPAFRAIAETDFPNYVAWNDYAGTSTVTGWASFTTKNIFYKRIGSTVYVAFKLQGTSNATTVSFTLPIAANATNPTFEAALANAVDAGGATGPGFSQLTAGSSTVSAFPTAAAGAWTNSGTKVVSGQFFYIV